MPLKVCIHDAPQLGKTDDGPHDGQRFNRTSHWKDKVQILYSSTDPHVQTGPVAWVFSRMGVLTDVLWKEEDEMHTLQTIPHAPAAGDSEGVSPEVLPVGLDLVGEPSEAHAPPTQ